MSQDPEKKRQDQSSANAIQQYLGQIKNAANLSQFDIDRFQDFKLKIEPDLSVTPGNFKPSKIVNGQYYAHPQTIAALKKNIFMPGDDFQDLEIPYQCESCKSNLDIQFWHFCPKCGREFPL